MHYQTTDQLVTALQKRQISSLELLDSAIARISTHDERWNAVIVRDFDRAREQARAADRALAKGDDKPLLGIPMTVKEAFDVSGLPTTWGIPGTESDPVADDAVVVKRLKAAGAIVLGKSNVPLMLSDWQSSNEVYGVTNNPWDVTRTPGGSSGGSAAALAAGYVPLELGSDIAGSLRAPAHFCGVFAHKPTHGLVPLQGIAPPGGPRLSVTPFIDLIVVGPMARSANDLMLALDVTAGPGEANAVAYRLELPPPRHTRLQDFRVLVVNHHPLLPTESAIHSALDSVSDRLQKAGCRLGRASPLLPDLAQIGKVYLELLMSHRSSEMPQAAYLQAQERAALVAPADPTLAAISSRSVALPHRNWILADQARALLAHQWRECFREWDVVLSPVMPTVAFPHDHRDMAERHILVDGRPVPYGDQPMWASMATLTGQPATAMPIGLSPEGLPIGMQILGPYLEDRTTLTFAHLVERELGGFVAPPAP